MPGCFEVSECCFYLYLYVFRDKTMLNRWEMTYSEFGPKPI